MSNKRHIQTVHIPAHVLGLLSLAFCVSSPSWSAMLGFLVFNFWLSGLGVSIGLHRYFTHRSFAVNRFWHYVMLIGGSLAGQGSPIFWVALHRMHHRNSDKQSDIHSPVHRGFWHAYMGWIFRLNPSEVKMGNAVDLIRDPTMKFVHLHYSNLMLTYWLTMIAIALWFPPIRGFIAGAFIAGMWSIHQEALINSVCHHKRFGVRPFDTTDSSRDVHGLHYVTWGQSLHNTHHAHPLSPNFGTALKPDIGYKVITWIRS